MGTPVVAPDQVSLTPSEEQTRLYLRAYLLMRLVVGMVGILLPLVLFIGDILVLEGSPGARGSISAYYHSGMRDVFVAGLSVIGVFLITYRVAEHPLTNRITTIAGVACIGVAFFPTTGLPGYTPTPLQEYFGISVTRTVHFICAATFILLLAAISVRFGREAQTKERGSPWAPYHYACAVVIVVACAYIAVTKLSGVGDEYSLLIGETAAVLAFGASWLSKGLELKVLLPRSIRRQPAGRGQATLTS